jgi:hypothetical protein
MRCRLSPPLPEVRSQLLAAARHHLKISLLSHKFVFVPPSSGFVRYGRNAWLPIAAVERTDTTFHPPPVWDSHPKPFPLRLTLRSQGCMELIKAGTSAL